MKARLLLPLSALASLVIGVSAFQDRAPLSGSASTTLHEGDILFQSTGGAQAEAIRLASGSEWTHVGILFKDQGAWMVYEAVGPVTATPLKEWAERGRDGHFEVKRLKGMTMDTQAILQLRRATEAFLGSPYDTGFRWSDERIYCSELVWKAYERGLGVELCKPEPMRAHELSDPLVQRTMKERYGNAPPLDELMIAPGALFDCPLLVAVAQ
ncbi:MAG: peptidoglycan peptidase [Flavobacteriales bacterium]|nr:peptidoglycan peptidase [Flavobacteriales bacterium]